MMTEWKFGMVLRRSDLMPSSKTDTRRVMVICKADDLLDMEQAYMAVGLVEDPEANAMYVPGKGPGRILETYWEVDA
jgi:hypothetical protein